MIKTIVSLANDVNYEILDNSVEVLKSEKKFNETFKNICYCGLNIQKRLSLNFKETVWSPSPDFNRAIIFVSQESQDEFDSVLNFSHDFRGDEILLPHIEHYRKISWMSGHPRSIVKLASTMLDLNDLPFYEEFNQDYTAEHLELGRVVWMSRRIGLRVFYKK